MPPPPPAATTRPRPRAAAAPPPRQAGRGLPRWIPVAAIVAVLLIIAGAIAALTNGGADKATAPIVATSKKAPAKKKTQKQPTTTQQSTTQPQTSSQTTPSTSSQTTPASGSPSQMQLQAHSLIGQGKYDDAIALDKQVVAAGPSSGLTYAYALYDLGHALRLAGRPAEAIPILEQRMKINNQRDVVKAELQAAKREAKSG
jgi:tetratricopeptide (TPR) repeat protein